MILSLPLFSDVFLLIMRISEPNNAEIDMARDADVELGLLQDNSPIQTTHEDESENHTHLIPDPHAAHNRHNALKVFGEALVVLSKLL